jgi:hypothetical protein
MEKRYNYIKIMDVNKKPLYILKVEQGSQDELLLVEMLFDNKVNFEKCDAETFDRMVQQGGEQHSISGKQLLEESERRNEPREGKEL